MYNDDTVQLLGKQGLNNKEIRHKNGIKNCHSNEKENTDETT